MSAYRPVEAKVGGWCDRCREKFEAGETSVQRQTSHATINLVHACLVAPIVPDFDQMSAVKPNIKYAISSAIAIDAGFAEELLEKK